MTSAATTLWLNEELMRSLQLTEDVTGNLGVHFLNVQTVLNRFIVFHPILYSIYVHAYNGISHDTANATNDIDHALEQELIALGGRGMFIHDVILDWNGRSVDVISFVRMFRNPQNLSEYLGIIKINLLEDNLARILGDNELFESSQTIIVDANHLVVSGPEKEIPGTFINEELLDPKLGESSHGFFSHHIEQQEFMITYSRLIWPEWILLNIVPFAEFERDNIVIRNITLLAILIGGLLCLFISQLVSHFVLKPLRNLTVSMRELEHENFSIVLPEKGRDEIALVCRSFNKMAHKLNELINQVYASELSQREAELKALHAQIDPHFLYNTLNTIYWVCQLEKAKKSGDLVQALSKLFRLSLANGHEITTIQKEVEHLNYYVLIQKARFESIDFQIDVNQDLLACNVLKLILQPLVENAIIHGIEQESGNGTITVKIYARDNIIVYEVIDTGVGVDVSKLYRLLECSEGNSPSNGSPKFGIKSVNNRIKLRYGEEYGVQFFSEIGKGMTVIVKQPLGGHRDD